MTGRVMKRRCLYYKIPTIFLLLVDKVRQLQDWRQESQVQSKSMTEERDDVL